MTEVVGRFETALAHGRGAVACAQLAPAARTALERDEGRPCPRAILALGLDGGGEVSRADVYMTSGYAEVGERAAFLDQTPQGWRIGAAGCTPTEPGLPYDCELED